MGEGDDGTPHLDPCPKRGIDGGKVIPLFFPGLLDLSLSVLMGKWLFEVPMRGSVTLLFALSYIYILVALALGLTISTFARTQLLANQMAMVIGFRPPFPSPGLPLSSQTCPCGFRSLPMGLRLGIM